MYPARSFISVVFPHPDLPTRAVFSPHLRVIERFSKTAIFSL
jgi:hypothetical protein